MSSILSHAILINIKPDLTHVSFISFIYGLFSDAVSRKLESLWKETL
jgi:hypothetical protein